MVEKDEQGDTIVHLERGDIVAASDSVTFRIHAPLPEEHPFYALVGRVTSEAAHLEHALDMIIWELAGIERHDLGACVTSQIIGPAPRCRAIRLLVGRLGLDGELARAAKELRKECGGLADRRNRFIHDPWYVEKTTGEPAQFKSMAFSEPVFGMKDIKKEELDKLIEQFREQREAASKLHAAVQQELAKRGRGGS